MRFAALLLALTAAAALSGAARADWSAELTAHVWNDGSTGTSCTAGVVPGRSAGGWFEWRFVSDDVRCPRTVNEYTQQHSHGTAISFQVVGLAADGNLLYGNVVTGRVAADGSVTWSKPATSLIDLEPGEKYELVLYVDWGRPDPPPCTACK